jgi:polysaccharide biosynthesis protein PslG
LTLVRSLLVLLVVGAIAISAHPPRADAAYQAPSLEYGASIFVLGRPETTGRDFDALKAAGLSWAKITVPWRSIEGACNDCYEWSDLDAVVNAAKARGIKLIARIDHPPVWARTVQVENGPPDNPEDLADIVSAMVAHYGAAGIPVIQVWNEPNLSREWGNATIDADAAQQYVHMLRRANEEAKKKDPNVTILSAGLSPTGTADGTAQPDDVYLQWMYDAGLAKAADAIGMHGNSYGLPPETPIMSDPSRPHPSFYFRRVEQLRDIMVANGDAAKQVWLLEFGYTSDQVNPAYSWFAIDETTKADYIVRAFKYARANWAPWIAEMTVWTFADPAWDQSREQYWWAITEPDGTPRPSYNALKVARANGTLP